MADLLRHLEDDDFPSECANCGIHFPHIGSRGRKKSSEGHSNVDNNEEEEEEDVAEDSKPPNLVITKFNIDVNDEEYTIEVCEALIEIYRLYWVDEVNVTESEVLKRRLVLCYNCGVVFAQLCKYYYDFNFLRKTNALISESQQKIEDMLEKLKEAEIEELEAKSDDVGVEDCEIQILEEIDKSNNDNNSSGGTIRGRVGSISEVNNTSPATASTNPILANLLDTPPMDNEPNRPSSSSRPEAPIPTNLSDLYNSPAVQLNLLSSLRHLNDLGAGASVPVPDTTTSVPGAATVIRVPQSDQTFLALPVPQMLQQQQDSNYSTTPYSNNVSSSFSPFSQIPPFSTFNNNNNNNPGGSSASVSASSSPLTPPGYFSPSSALSTSSLFSPGTVLNASSLFSPGFLLSALSNGGLFPQGLGLSPALTSGPLNSQALSSSPHLGGSALYNSQALASSSLGGSTLFNNSQALGNPSALMGGAFYGNSGLSTGTTLFHPGSAILNSGSLFSPTGTSLLSNGGVYPQGSASVFSNSTLLPMGSPSILTSSSGGTMLSHGGGVVNNHNNKSPAMSSSSSSSGLMSVSLSSSGVPFLSVSSHHQSYPEPRSSSSSSSLLSSISALSSSSNSVARSIHQSSFPSSLSVSGNSTDPFPYPSPTSMFASVLPSVVGSTFTNPLQNKLPSFSKTTTSPSAAPPFSPSKNTFTATIPVAITAYPPVSASTSCSSSSIVLGTVGFPGSGPASSLSQVLPSVATVVPTARPVVIHHPAVISTAATSTTATTTSTTTATFTPQKESKTPPPPSTSPATTALENAWNANTPAVASSSILRPFKCDHCGARFATRRAQSTHSFQTHNRENGFKCEVCSKYFISKRNLQVHLTTQHLEVIDESDTVNNNNNNNNNGRSNRAPTPPVVGRVFGVGPPNVTVTSVGIPSGVVEAARPSPVNTVQSRRGSGGSNNQISAAAVAAASSVISEANSAQNPPRRKKCSNNKKSNNSSNNNNNNNNSSQATTKKLPQLPTDRLLTLKEMILLENSLRAKALATPVVTTTTNNATDSSSSVPGISVPLPSDAFPMNCVDCHEPFNSFTELHEHRMESHPVDQPFKCHICKLALATAHSFNLHMLKHAEEEQRGSEARFRALNNINNNKSARSSSNKTPPQVEVIVTPAPAAVLVTIPCEFCNLSFLTNSELGKHISTVHQFKRVRIEKLSSVSSSAGSAVQEAHPIQSLIPPTTATPANDPTTTTANKTNKASSSPPKRKSSKPIKRKATSDNSNKSNKVSKSGGKCNNNNKERPCRSLYCYRYSREALIFKCSDCSEVCTTAAALGEHRHINHPDVHAFKCYICYKDVSRANSLSDHMKRHTGIRPYRCKMCSNTFKTAGDARQHYNSIHGALSDPEKKAAAAVNTSTTTSPTTETTNTSSNGNPEDSSNNTETTTGFTLEMEQDPYQFMEMEDHYEEEEEEEDDDDEDDDDENYVNFPSASLIEVNLSDTGSDSYHMEEVEIFD